MLDVVCFGAAVQDTRARALGTVREGTSNPVSSFTTSGGVARNVAECLARLGLEVALVSRVGDDLAGQSLIGELEGIGVVVDGIARSSRQPTATYTALLDRAGNLAIGLADMAVFDEIRPETLNLAAAESSRAWFVDSNLPPSTLRYLLEHPRRPPLVAANTVSMEKAKRLAGLVDRIDLLYCNQSELDHIDASRPKATVVTGQDQGAMLQEGRRVSIISAFASDVVDVTGAGDCAAAATLWALLQGLPVIEAVRIGQAAAALSVASPRAVPQDLTLAVLKAKLAA